MRIKYETVRLFTSLDSPERVYDRNVVRGKGEVVAFIPGGMLSEDKFLIADDATGKFIKVDVADCSILNEEYHA